MSQFSARVKALIKASGIKQTVVAGKLGWADSQVTKLLKGEKSVKASELESVVLNVTGDPREQSELVAAHLLDQLSPPMQKLVHISLCQPSGALKPASPVLDDLEIALDTLRRAAKRDQVWRRRVLDDAALAGIVLGKVKLKQTTGAKSRPAKV